MRLAGGGRFRRIFDGATRRPKSATCFNKKLATPGFQAYKGAVNPETRSEVRLMPAKKKAKKGAKKK